MTNLKRNSHLENEFSLLTEMEMLHVFGGDGDIIINPTNTAPGCQTTVNPGCGSGTGSGSGSGSGSGNGSGSGSGNGSGSGSGNGSGSDNEQQDTYYGCTVNIKYC